MRLRRLSLIGAIAFAVSVGMAGAAAGDLDPSFGGDGTVVTDFAGGSDNANDLVVQPDGKLLAVGRTGVAGSDVGLARYLPDGGLDGSFGAGGKVTTDFGGFDYATAVALQPDGKIVVVGTSEAPMALDWVVARYLDGGGLDPTFGGGDGKVTLSIGQLDFSSDVVLQPDGKIVVSGSSIFALPPGDNDFALARFLPDGSLDASFGDGGVVVSDIGSSSDQAMSLALQEDGKLVVAGGTLVDFFPAFAVARYEADGDLDATFGAGGVVVTDLPGSERHDQIALQPDGKIVAAGWAGQDFALRDFALARYLSDGALDASFGDGGIVVSDLGATDMAFAVALQADGRIVAAGQSGVSAPPVAAFDFAVARYLSDGSLDPSFGGDGLVTTDFGSGFESALGVALQANGRIVAAGETFGAGVDFAVARYLVSSAPTSKDECKNGGWKDFTDPVLRNQGDCVSYVASTGKARGKP